MAPKTGGDYEPIPDVENGIVTTTDHHEEDKSQEYADMGLDGDQTELLLSLDSAIHSSNLQLSIPSVHPSELASQGKSFVLGILSPTIAAACTFATALYLQKISQYNSVASLYLVPAFFYVNATVMFLTTAWPMQERFMDAVRPLFKKSDSLKQQVMDTVNQIGPNVDTTIDDIQNQVRTVLKPMEPTLQKAKSRTAAFKQVDPSLEIPDTSDLDREFDEMQGVVTDKIEQAADQVVLDKFIPVYLQSPSAFYWRIVVPVLVIALLMQLGVAFIGQHQHNATTATSTNSTLNMTSTTTMDLPMNGNLRGLMSSATAQDQNMDEAFHGRHLLRGLQVDDETPNDYQKNRLDNNNNNNTAVAYKNQLNLTVNDHKDQLDDSADAYKDQLNSTISDYKNQAGDTVNQYKSQASDTVNEYKDKANEYKNQASDTVNEYKKQAGDTVNEYKDKANDYKNQASDTVSEYKNRASDTVNDYKNQAGDTVNEYKDQFNSTVNDYKNQFNVTDYQDQLDEKVAQSQSLVRSVLVSYMVSFLQLALVYLLTNERVKAWVLRTISKKMQDEAVRTLRQYGVTTALQNVLGTQMSKVRTQILSILTVYKKIEALMGNIPNVDQLGDAVSSLTGGSVSAKDVNDKVSSLTGGVDISDKVSKNMSKFSGGFGFK